jgi:flagellar biosynthetic protein FlhB
MPETHGEKTEQPTPRRLEEAAKKGQHPRSGEVQTVFVLLAGLLAFVFAGNDAWRQLVGAFAGTLSHLHDLPVSTNVLQRFCLHGSFALAQCAGPFVIAAMLGGLLAGGIQARFQTASEVLGVDWERVNPAAGFRRIFSTRAAAPTAVAAVKLGTVIALTYSQVAAILNDPIFYSVVSPGRIGQFMAATVFGVLMRVVLAMMVIAAADYAYQFWRTHRDMMMTKDELREETKHTEGDPLVRARQRRRAQRYTQRWQFEAVRKADVVVTNPTHLAIALRYERPTMKAPKIVAKGSRLNAQRIREIAQQAQVPVVENQPLARMLFKYGRVGAEIPVQLYQAVAEILAWVYRINRYRYFAELNQARPEPGGGTA